MLNVGQRNKRRDMVRLYGNARRLLTKGIDVESSKTMLPLFGIQVSSGAWCLHPSASVASSCAISIYMTSCVTLASAC